MRYCLCSLALSLMLLSTGCFQVERNCADFKTGKFEFEYSVDGDKKTSTFIRTENYSIDYLDEAVDSSSIRWINDCEFILTNVNPKNRTEEKAIHFKILSTSKDSYNFEYQMAMKDPYKKVRIEKGTAKKID